MKPFAASLLATALSLLIAGPAFAADDKPATEAELAAARAELDRAARRYSELARGQAQTARGQAAEALERATTARMHLERIGNRPVIGVLLASDEQPGVRITGITPDGAASKAGLRSGDRLVSVDGKEILGSTGELRVENARKLLGGLETDKSVQLSYLRDGRRANIAVVPQRDRRIAIFNHADGSLIRPDGNVLIERLADGGVRMNADSIELEKLIGIGPDIQRQVTRISTGEAPRLLSAFRWNGLNLASVDAELGRYFGTDKGVLVLSTGEMEGLRAGDVIQRVDGKAVATPREVMDTLRDKDEGDTVAVDYLRDRRNGQARVAIPKLMAWPPTPPAPPAPPSPPTAAPKAPTAPPAPPAPPRAALEAEGGVAASLALLGA